MDTGKAVSRGKAKVGPLKSIKRVEKFSSQKDPQKCLGGTTQTPLSGMMESTP
jgi:hypothetical protein